jgi:hypothetical protein
MKLSIQRVVPFALKLLSCRTYAQVPTFRGFGGNVVIAFTLFASASFALPKDLSNYEVVNGGLVNIEPSAYVEGSFRQGGIQPDYYIDVQTEPLKGLLEKAKRIGVLPVDYWDRVGMVIELVQTDFFRYTNYNNPYYRRLLKRYRIRKDDVPLSDYVSCRAGVCREHALALHFALKAAGIANKHAYAKIYRASAFYNFQITEDHAFNVIEHGGVAWVADAYYWGFNGFRLIDLMSPEGITEASPTAPIARGAPGTRKILQINSFPRIFNPKMTAARCDSFLLE